MRRTGVNAQPHNHLSQHQMMRSALIAVLFSLVGIGCATTHSVTPSSALVVGTHVVRFSGDRVSKMVFKSDGTFTEVRCQLRRRVTSKRWAESK
jgi:hypothetical protein